MKILIADKFGPELPGLLAKYGEVYIADESKLPEADILLIRSATKVRGEYLERAENLKLVIRGGVGIDNIDSARCAERGILVRNTPEASAIAVAEMAFALMLATVRHIPAADRGTKAGEWPKKQLKGTELCGKTLGLVGMGLIATEVAKRARAFGMDVIAHRASGKPSDWAEIVTLDTLFARADFISLHVPYNEATHELINAANIAKMKDGAILINTARGKCVNTADLVSALETGKLRAAGIDVYTKEPVETDSPLLTAKNVVLAPHLGASSDENMTRIGLIADRIIGEFMQGR